MKRIIWMLALFGFVIALIGTAMWAFPKYNVWQQGLAGEARLKEAEWSKQIILEQAKIKGKAAQYEADAKLIKAKGDAAAEVARAEGVAEANEIIGDSLRDNETYLTYLWIQGLHDGNSEVIYVPTEANLPILEASRKAK